MSVSKRVRIYTLEDLDAHKSAQSCWVTHKGKVYNVTAFVTDHPGGDDLILSHAGTDVENIMRDSDSHDHSESAYEMLEEYVIGRLGTEATTVSDGASSTCLSAALAHVVQRLGSDGRLPPGRYGLGRGLCKDPVPQPPRTLALANVERQL